MVRSRRLRVLTGILVIVTILTWFFAVSKAGGFAPIAMMMYVPGYLAIYGIMYWRMGQPMRAAGKVLLPLLAVLVIAATFFFGLYGDCFGL